MFNKIFDKKLTTSINANHESFKSLQSQIDELNKTLNTIYDAKILELDDKIHEVSKTLNTIYDAKILELDDKIKFHDNILKYKLWTCEEYHEDRHIPVDDFLRLLDMGMVKGQHCGSEYTSLVLNGGHDYFNGKDCWISKLSSDDYYRVAKAVRLYKKSIHFDHFILSDIYEDNQNYHYLYLLEQLHIKYSKKYITDERFDICRKTLLLLKEDGLLY
jgi:hypothetical protein